MPLEEWRGVPDPKAPGPGAPIKRLHSNSDALNGLELLLKGGQMGSIDLFDRFAAY